MGWIRCVRCEKSRCDFVAQTFALIAPIHPVLHRVSCSYETIPNAPKYDEIDRNISFGSNGVDWVHSLRKIPMRLSFTNFCTSSAPFALSFIRQQNGPECTQIVQNAQKRQFRVQWGGSGAFIANNSDETGTNFCTSSARFAPRFVRHPNRPECTQIVRNAPKHQFRVQWGGSGAFIAKNSDATSWHKLLH